MVGEGGILRTGRSGGDSAAIQKDLDKLTEKREIILREIDEVQLKSNLARRELDAAGRVGNPQDIERWTKEIAALDTRYKVATEELNRIGAETESKISAMKGAVAGGDPDTVNPGESIRLIVTEDDSYNAIYRVQRDGSITVKNLGRVAVGGKKIGDAETVIKAKLEESQLTKATVTLEFVDKPNTGGGGGGGGGPLPTEATIIYLAGEFITPGPLKIPDGVSPTLITTIIRSGGITPSGDLTRTKLLRIDNGMGAVEEINVAAILSGSIPPMDIALNPGDIIMIPAFAPVVYVTGNVTKPGTLRLFQDETLTAYAAILRAGGFSRFANLKKCYVVRDLGNGEKMQMPLNVKEIQRGLAPDIVLQGKDIVVVPESFFSF
jgi:protein involved in polysaccharide export with SLBB domain